MLLKLWIMQQWRWKPPVLSLPWQPEGQKNEWMTMLFLLGSTVWTQASSPCSWCSLVSDWSKPATSCRINPPGCWPKGSARCKPARNLSLAHPQPASPCSRIGTESSTQVIRRLCDLFWCFLEGLFWADKAPFKGFQLVTCALLPEDTLAC